MRIPLYFVVAADRARQVLEAMGLEYDDNVSVIPEHVVGTSKQVPEGTPGAYPDPDVEGVWYINIEETVPEERTRQGHPRIRLGGAWFLVYRCSGPGAEGQPPKNTWTIPGNPSSGTGERWAIYLLHPEEPFRRRAKALWLAIQAKATSPENTNAQGQRHILGVFTPARFYAEAPPSIVADVCPGGALPHVIFGDDPVTLAAADDADLEGPA